MGTAQRKLHLNAFLMSTGHHEASWRLPESDPLAGTDVRHYQNLARLAERGRAGWNVVTTAGPDAARNFGVDDQPAHAARYERAAEFLDVAGKLWDSWDDDAVVADKESGVWADADRVRPIDHEGKHFKFAGPLTFRAPPRVTR